MTFGRRSFTLAEVMVALSISVLVGGVIYSFWIFGMRTSQVSTQQSFVQSHVRTKLDYLMRELRSARFIREVKPNKISFQRFYDPKTEPNRGFSDDPMFKTVEYTIRDRGGRKEFVRREQTEETVLFVADSIGESLFFPYYEPEKGEGYLPFDMEENDSGHRARITFIRLRLLVKSQKRAYSVASAVSLRTPHKLLRQTTWNRNE